MAPELEWSKLPKEISYLASPAEKYGVYQFEEKIYTFLRGMSEDDRRELKALLGRIIKDDTPINAWLDEYEITNHREAALVYFMNHLIALANEGGFLQ
jgi:hypothetical protein